MRSGERGFGAIEREGMQTLASQGFRPDYFSIRDAELGLPAAQCSELIVLTAARLGKARLIDNLRA